MNKVIIHAELYSTKNSKQILKRGDKRFIGKSFKAMANQKELVQLLTLAKWKWEMPTEWPVYLHFDIYRKTNRAYDYNNIVQGLQDAMVQADYLPDDNMNYIIPVYYPHKKDKDDPRVEIWWTKE